MLQLRSGDLVAVGNNGLYVLAAILTKQVLFGGHWSFVFHGTHPNVPTEPFLAKVAPGFNAAVDFIIPKREGRIIRIARGGDFSALLGPSLMHQSPLKGNDNYRIWKWKDMGREEAEFVRFTPSPTEAERVAPEYSCLAADCAWQLAARNWTPDKPMYDASNNRIERARER